MKKITALLSALLVASQAFPAAALDLERGQGPVIPPLTVPLVGIGDVTAAGSLDQIRLNPLTSGVTPPSALSGPQALAANAVVGFYNAGASSVIAGQTVESHAVAEAPATRIGALVASAKNLWSSARESAAPIQAKLTRGAFLAAPVAAVLASPAVAHAAATTASVSAAGADYWDVHGIAAGLGFAVMLSALPRATLAWLALVSHDIGITFWGSVGWVLAPRLTVAAIATTIYWNTNPVLCVLAWMGALAGESAEKKAASSRRD